MIEFVTKDGHRFPVVEHGGSYYAVTESHGARWITPSVHGKGYAIAVDGITIVGTLRVKAALKEPEAVKMIDIATMRGYIDVLDCINNGWPIYVRGVKYRVLSVHKGDGAALFSAKVEPWLDSQFRGI